MLPIVNGLEDEYGDEVAFQSVDANSATGQAAFLAYRLRSHPAYVLIDPDGEMLWFGVGQQQSSTLSQAIEEVLDAP